MALAATALRATLFGLSFGALSLACSAAPPAGGDHAVDEAAQSGASALTAPIFSCSEVANLPYSSTPWNGTTQLWSRANVLLVRVPYTTRLHLNENDMIGIDMTTGAIVGRVTVSDDKLACFVAMHGEYRLFITQLDQERTGDIPDGPDSTRIPGDGVHGPSFTNCEVTTALLQPRIATGSAAAVCPRATIHHMSGW